MRILLVGGGGREHAIADALCRNSSVQLFSVMGNENPGIGELSSESRRHPETDIDWIVEWASGKGIDLAVVGFEDPLALGLCDALEARGIRSFGPNKAAAQLETSKLFARELMRRHGIPGQVEFRCFTNGDDVRSFIGNSSKAFAIKPLGLSAGKGVKVMGEHLNTPAEAIAYAREVIGRKIGGEAAVIVEERLEGEEFTLQCFVDGETVVPMPLVQDYKRAYEGNTGPNTGSMGSYSQADGQLAFLSSDAYSQALQTIEGSVNALREEGTIYTGVLYGQFMLTSGGPKLIEFNARFGDPEAINVLAILESDLAEICVAVAAKELARTPITFRRAATVCKYVVPPGYGSVPEVDIELRIDRSKCVEPRARFYMAKVNGSLESFRTTTSRAFAVLGTGESIQEADRVAEAGLNCVVGSFDVRHDIGRISPSGRPLTAARSGGASTRSAAGVVESADSRLFGSASPE